VAGRPAGPDAGRQLLWFGYVSTGHYSLMPVVVFPILYAVCLPTLVVVCRRAGSRREGIPVVVALLASAVFVLTNASRDFYRS
jgi:hypothetical protein